MALLRSIVIALFVCATITACKDDENTDFKPNFSWFGIGSVSGTSVSFDLSVNGSDAEINEVFVAWNNEPGVAATSANKLVAPNISSFHGEITSLQYNTTYYLKAFISTVNYGIIESEELSVLIGAPNIYKFPTEGFTGDEVTFLGTALSPNISDYVVRFADQIATVTSVDGDVLKVIVPEGLLPIKVRPVVKIQSLNLVSTVDFKVYKIPVITSVSPTSGFVGDNILVRGKYFEFPISTTLKAGTTTMNLNDLDNSDPDNARMRFTIPSMQPGEYEVSFNMMTKTVTLPGKLTVLAYPWIKKHDFPGGAREGMVGFTIGTKAYVGLGVAAGTRKRDFWEYDMTADTWTQKADFPGDAREDAVAFMVGNKGYVGCGFKDTFTTLKDFWEYNPATNSWTQRADFGGTARASATAIAIGNSGYVGLGRDATILKKDWWEYNPSANTWTQRADFIGQARESATGFTIGSKGYVGYGNANSLSALADFYDYNPANDTWTQKATARFASRAISFVFNGQGYVAGGFDQSINNSDLVWRYNPDTNQWLEVKSMTAPRNSGVGFASSTHAFIVTGNGADHNPTTDVFQFTPY